MPILKRDERETRVKKIKAERETQTDRQGGKEKRKRKRDHQRISKRKFQIF
jgi:hypothetical protein